MQAITMGSPTLPSHGRVSATLAWLVAGLLLLAGCRSSSETAPPPAAPAAQLVDPTARPIVVAPLRGERPDSWIRSLPDRPAVVLAVDLRSLMATVIDGPWNLLGLSQEKYAGAVAKWVGKFDSRPDLANAVKQLRWEAASTVVLAAWGAEQGGAESTILLTDPAALDLPLRDGGPPASLTNTRFRAALRGSRLLVGDGPAFEAALATHATFNPEARWPEGWAKLPAKAFATVWLDPSVPSPKSLAELQKGHQLIAAGLSSDGSAVVLHSAQQPWLAPATARGFEMGRSLIESQRVDATPTSKPLWDYADLLHRAIWSRVALSADGGLEQLRLLPPACGNAANNLTVAAIVATLIQRSSLGPLPAGPFVTPTVRLQDDCSGIAGPAPRLPRSLVSLASAETKGGALFLLADSGALLRAHLPSLFGLLPFTLHADELTQTLGANPFGLRSWGDSEGSGAFFIEQATNASVAVLHPGAADLPWVKSLTAGLDTATDKRRGWIAARGEPSIAARLAAPPTPASSWSRGATLPPSDAILALMLNRTYLAAIVSYAARPDLQQALARAEVVAFSLRADLSPVLSVWLPTGAADAASLLHDAVQEGVAKATHSADEEGSAGATVADALKLVTVEALDDHRLQLSLSRGGPFVMAAAAMLAAPIAAEVYGLAGRISAAAVAPKAAKPPAPPARP